MTNPNNLFTALSQASTARQNLREAEQRVVELTAFDRVDVAQTNLARATQQLQSRQRELQELQSSPTAFLDTERLEFLNFSIGSLESIVGAAQQQLTRDQNQLAQAQSNVVVAQRQLTQAEAQVDSAQAAPSTGQGTDPVSVTPPNVTDPPPPITPVTAGAPANVATGTGFGDDQDQFTTDSRGNLFRDGTLFRAAEIDPRSDPAGFRTVDPNDPTVTFFGGTRRQPGPLPPGPGTGVAAGEVVTAPIITPTITATPLPPQDIGTATGFGDDDTSVFPTTAPAQVSSGTGFGDDDTTVFDSLSRGPQDPTGVLAAEDAAIAEQAAAQSDAEAFGPTTFGPTPPPPGTGYGDDQEEFTTDSLGNTFRNGQLYRAAEVDEDISQRDGFKLAAQQQATLRARYVEPSSQDWRVRLVLAGGANYLYEDDNNAILKPLQDSNGVIFPYTPQISTTYNAAYDETQLTHSNYRGYFYKGSFVGDINITATFTAQDTKEAQYLLAVIHFFRSVTKMFYGQDAQRGTPPPLVYIVGLGEFQFNGHACLVSQFNYNLPADVDYIRATGFNNYGVNLLNRRSQASQTFPGSSLLGSTSRLLASKLLGFPGAEPARPAPGPVTGGVNNTVRSTYVPTKMEIALTLKPVQSRAQMSREFSLKNFANGNLLKGGYW